MLRDDTADQDEWPVANELHTEDLHLVSGGLSPVEFGMRVAAFVLSCTF
jgi:hypothetical protein